LIKILNSEFDVVAAYINFGEPLSTRAASNHGEGVPITVAALIIFRRDGNVNVLYPSSDPVRQKEMLVHTNDPSLTMGSMGGGRASRDFYLKNTLRKLIMCPGGSFVSADPIMTNKVYSLEVADLEVYVSG